jgi:mannosylglycerate hydrolase
MGAELAYGITESNQGTLMRHAREFAHPAWVREMPYLPYLNQRSEQAHSSTEGVISDSVGTQPRSASWCAINNPQVILSALKPAEEPGTIVLRLYNQSSQVQAATIDFGFPVHYYCETNCLEVWQETQQQSVSDQQLTLTFQPHQIKTILLHSA